MKVIGTKLETLQEKLAKLQSDIVAEQHKAAVGQATAEVRDALSEAIVGAITIHDTDTGKSPRDIGFGIWVAYPKDPEGTLMVSALTVGDDGLPAALRRTPAKKGTNGNGKHYECALADGRVFEKCEEAVKARGIGTRDTTGEYLEGKQYYFRQ